MAAGIDGILHTFLSAKAPRLGIAGAGFMTKNGQAGYPVILAESA